MKTFHIWISGMVQDVGFRYFTNRNAKELGIRGWVRNTSDGKVEAVFQGNETDVNEMVGLCKKGPSSSHIKDVNVTEETNDIIYDNFQITY